MIVPLTDDLDRVSNELFALETNGGDEYCGKVIQAATGGLKWSESGDDLKLIFIAGNEPFTQGDVDYKTACSAAIARGITVNTIFCGPTQEGINTGWRDGALLADGSFLSIDQNQQVAVVETPFDKDLAKLSSQVNETYVLIGKEKDRRAASSQQVAADSAAATSAPAAAAERAEFKGKAQYRASGRDLVDELKKGTVTLRELKEEELPKELQPLNEKEREAFVKQKAVEREKIQQQIQKLGQKRKEYLAEQEKQNADGNKSDTLDTAIIKSIREQAARKHYMLPALPKK
jgi:hypothetical protein